MKIAVIGAGHIGGHIARRLASAGHSITLSFARNPAALLEALAKKIGAELSPPAQAVGACEVVVISVPWSVLPEAIRLAGSLEGKVVIDTTNQYGSGPMPSKGQTAASFNAARMPGARYTKSFNTLTAAFQEEVADRPQDQKVVQWLCGDDAEAKTIVGGLIRAAGFVPVDIGGIANCEVMEAPRRAGAVYGEEYRASDAGAVVESVRMGRPIPPSPVYGSATP